MQNKQSDSDAPFDLYEVHTHPFVVKVWLEETAEEADTASWRGHITHVPTGKRQYLSSLDDIYLFIAPYLESMGVKLKATRWFRRWLNKGTVFRRRQHN